MSERSLLPSPIRPEAAPNRPLLFLPHPNTKSSTGVVPRVSRSLPSSPRSLAGLRVALHRPVRGRHQRVEEGLRLSVAQPAGLALHPREVAPRVHDHRTRACDDSTWPPETMFLIRD